MSRFSELPSRPITSAFVRCSDEQLALVQFAANTLKEAGFEHAYTSMQSEACYYRLGNREGTLRIAAHRFGHRSEGKILHFPVWSCLTFAGVPINSAQAALAMIDCAVGRYIMYPHTKLASARGKMIPVAHLFITETR